MVVCVCVCLQLAAVEDMRVSLEMLVGLRTEADSLHERALAAADRRDEAAQALIKRLALQVTRLEAQVRELHERERMFEDALFSQAKDAPDSDSSSDSSEDENEEASESESESEQSSEQSSDSSSSEEEETEEEKEEEKEKEEKKKEEEGRETDVGTAAQTGAPRTPGSVKKSPALAHVPLQSAPAPERTSIALPPQSPLTAPRAHSPAGSADTGADSAGTGGAAAVRVAQLERIVKFYEELTGVTVQPGPDPAGELQSPRFACTAVDCRAQRAVQFQLLFGERSVEYTPTRIDVPADLALSEEVTEAIEFSSTLTPIFLVKLIDELNSTVVPG